MLISLILKIFKYFLKKISLFIILLPFSDLVSFFFDVVCSNFIEGQNSQNSDSDFNEKSNDVDKEGEEKYTAKYLLKVFAISAGIIFIFYLIIKYNDPNEPSNATSMSNNIDTIKRQRLDNALNTTRRILEIKKFK